MRTRTIVVSLIVVFLLSLSGIFENEAMRGKIHADA